jgi:hypothetical protein
MRAHSVRRVKEKFASAYAKLDRAEEHMAELKLRLVAHMSRPDVVVGRVEYRPDKPGKENLLTHVTVQGLPHSVPVIAGDVVHNLRSALDHVAWQLVIINGGTPVEPGTGRRATQFPILRDPPKQLEVAGGISAAALEVVREAQPYACSDWRGRLLAALQHISNTDKHREAVRGRKGIDGWVTWSETADFSQPWDAPIELHEPNEDGVQIRFSARPGEPGDRGGMARHWVEIEMSPEGQYEPLYAALSNISWAVRQLVDRLVATASGLPPTAMPEQELGPIRRTDLAPVAEAGDLDGPVKRDVQAVEAAAWDPVHDAALGPDAAPPPDQ